MTVQRWRPGPTRPLPHPNRAPNTLCQQSPAVDALPLVSCNLHRLSQRTGSRSHHGANPCRDASGHGYTRGCCHCGRADGDASARRSSGGACRSDPATAAPTAAVLSAVRGDHCDSSNDHSYCNHRILLALTRRVCHPADPDTLRLNDLAGIGSQVSVRRWLNVARRGAVRSTVPAGGVIETALSRCYHIPRLSITPNSLRDLL